MDEIVEKLLDAEFPETWTPTFEESKIAEDFEAPRRFLLFRLDSLRTLGSWLTARTLRVHVPGGWLSRCSDQRGRTS